VNSQSLGTDHTHIKKAAFQELVKAVFVIGQLIIRIRVSKLIYADLEGVRHA
jgi:hypothetical protein